MSLLKKCSKCQKEKPITEFGKNKAYSDGFDCYCKNCRYSYSKTKKSCFKCNYDCFNCPLPDCNNSKCATEKEVKMLEIALGKGRERLI